MSTHDDTNTHTAQYLPGERVRVSFTATIAARGDDGAMLAHLDGFNGGYDFLIPANATITRECPAEGIPQPGDLWRDRNRRDWLTLVNERMVNRVGTDLPWTMVNTDHGPLTLIYRPSPAIDHIPAAEPAEAVSS
jgi:hypothetical protein